MREDSMISEIPKTGRRAAEAYPILQDGVAARSLIFKDNIFE